MPEVPEGKGSGEEGEGAVSSSFTVRGGGKKEKGRHLTKK